MSTFLTYFDEIKPDHKVGRNYYLIGGIVVPFESVLEIEKLLNDLSEKYFGTKDLIKETEFHASDIYSGKGPYKGMKAEDRIQILKDLSEVLSKAIDLGTGKVWSCVNIDLLRYDTDHAKAAFALFCEKVQTHITRKNFTLLIGDLDGEESKKMIRDFSKYRANGKTPWE